MSDSLGPNDLDLPYEDVPGGPVTANLSHPLVAGGLVVRAAVVPTLNGNHPALVFDFHLADGTVLRPIVLVADADQIGKTVPLVDQAAKAAIKASERAS